MSLILDALKRSEQTDSPISYAPSNSHQSAGATRLRPIVAALLLGALLGAGVVTWFSLESPDDALSSGPLASPLLDPSSTDQMLGAQPESLLIVDLSEQGSAAGPQKVSSPSRPVDTGATETARAVAELNAQMWSDSESAAAESPDGASDKVPERPSESAASEAATPELPETRSAPSRVADLDSIPPPIDLEKAIAEAAKAVGEQSLVPHATTMLENLSQQQKDDIPTLIYSTHDFQTDGSATVELNGQRLKVGQRAGPVRVKDILIDSVILEISGVTFRLAALNSWVNM
jgi:hypothetical protein